MIANLTDKQLATFGPDHLFLGSDHEAREIAELFDIIGPARARALISWGTGNSGVGFCVRADIVLRCLRMWVDNGGALAADDLIEGRDSTLDTAA